MFGFNDPFGFNSQMNSMMNNFMMDPFAPPHQRNINNNNNNNNNNGGNQRSNQVAMRADPFAPFNMMMSPFDQHHQAMMGAGAGFHHQNPFALMNQMMGMGGGMNMMNTVHADPNSAVFSSSSVISYSSSGDGGRPKIYQESQQIRQGPGGVKETRQMVKDSERGIEKVAVGHHIGDRSHVIERQKVNGAMEEIVNLENLDDDDIPEFNREFEDKLTSHVRSTHGHGHGHRTHHHHLNNNQPLAIEPGRTQKKNSKDKERKSKPKSNGN